jgi:hypothetical protein
VSRVDAADCAAGALNLALAFALLLLLLLLSLHRRCCRGVAPDGLQQAAEQL